MGSRKRRDGGKVCAQLATTNNQIRIFRADPELPKILVVPQLPNQVVAQLLKKGLGVIARQAALKVVLQYKLQYLFCVQSLGAGQNLNTVCDASYETG